LTGFQVLPHGFGHHFVHAAVFQCHWHNKNTHFCRRKFPSENDKITLGNSPESEEFFL